MGHTDGTTARAATGWRRAAALPAAVAVLAVAGAGVAAPAQASGSGGRPETVSIAPVTAPEGFAAGTGSTFYVGDRSGGDVYRGDVRGGPVTRLVAPTAGGVAVGLFFDQSTRRLWVAGGPTGLVTAYDADSGARLFQARTGGGFLNDLVVTRDAVYVTDSNAAALYVVDLGPGRSLPADGTVRRLAVGGDYVQPTGFGLNGIRELPGGQLVVTSGGVLYTVDPGTGRADRIRVSGARLTGGDGLVLRGSSLYVVRGFADRDSVVELRLKTSQGTASVVRELTDPDFQTPTTAGFVTGRLYAVNGQFGAEGTPTEVVRVGRG